MHWDMFYYALTRNTINFLVVILFKDNKKNTWRKINLLVLECNIEGFFFKDILILYLHKRFFNKQTKQTKETIKHYQSKISHFFPIFPLPLFNLWKTKKVIKNIWQNFKKNLIQNWKIVQIFVEKYINDTLVAICCI